MEPLPIVCSTGMGVQSSTIMHLVLTGDLPRPDLWQFADTGDEPASVYRNLQYWQKRLEDAGMTLQILRADETLSEHVLGRAEAGAGGISMVPAYVDREERPGRMPIRRGCTRDFKTPLMDRAAKAHFKVKRGTKTPRVRRWLGISTDEAARMKPAEAPWFIKEYPLVDLGYSRARCIEVLRAAGHPVVRSACLFCPHHSDFEWKRLRSEEPEEFKKAVAFERRLMAAWERHGVAGLKSRPTLHRSGVPLDEVDWDSQGDLWGGWDNECAGICGV